jgi:transposase InsO family protein
MTSKPVAMLLADLGVTKSHSRPKVSNDNPYSESQFKTHRAERRPPCPEGRPARAYPQRGHSQIRVAASLTQAR